MKIRIEIDEPQNGNNLCDIYSIEYKTYKMRIRAYVHDKALENTKLITDDEITCSKSRGDLIQFACGKMAQEFIKALNEEDESHKFIDFVTGKK
jgi:hypothetical protein